MSPADASLSASYGWLINVVSLWSAANCWQTIKPAVGALSIIILRRSLGTLKVASPDRPSVASLPVEVLERIRNSLISISLEETINKKEEGKPETEEVEDLDADMLCSGEYNISPFLHDHGLVLGNGNTAFGAYGDQQDDVRKIAVCVSVPLRGAGVDHLFPDVQTIVPVDGPSNAFLSLHPPLVAALPKHEKRLMQWRKLFRLKAVRPTRTVGTRQPSNRPMWIISMEAGP